MTSLGKRFTVGTLKNVPLKKFTLVKIAKENGFKCEKAMWKTAYFSHLVIESLFPSVFSFLFSTVFSSLSEKAKRNIKDG